MNRRLQPVAMPILRWTVGLVVLWESFQFAFSASAAQHFARTGLPTWIRPLLAGAEIIAALLFLAPGAIFIGGCMLLAVFAIAAIVHLLHGDYGIGALLVYAAAVIVCISQPAKPATEVSHDHRNDR